MLVWQEGLLEKTAKYITLTSAENTYLMYMLQTSLA